MGKTFTVRLHADQFDRLSRRTQPVTAVAELVWNALDAESEQVDVIINRTEFDAVDSVVVRDRGHGMTTEEVDRDFVQLGGSWKRGRTESKHGRRKLHGRKGEGRIRAFALGRQVAWETAAEIMTGEVEQLTITGSMDAGEFNVSDARPANALTPGTTVRITEPREAANQLLGSKARTDLLVHFVLVLLRQPDTTIVFDGEVLNPAELVAGEVEVSLDPEIGAGHGTPLIRIVAWNEHGKSIRPSLLLCSNDGAVLHENAERVPTLKDYPYTGYVLWDGFVEHASQLELADLGDPVLAPVLEAARAAIRSPLFP